MSYTSSTFSGVPPQIRICIPSYKRADICNTQTLQTLHEAKVPRECIHVFVANQKEHDIYSRTLDAMKYHVLHKGRKGLVQQREFIMNTFATGDLLVFLDDDVKSIDLSLSPLFHNVTLTDFFHRAFDICKRHGASIWGVYPVFNPFFRQPRPDVNIGLSYIVGACYGIVNTPGDKRVQLELTRKNGQKEDVERTIKYYLRDGVVLRFDRIGFMTRYYGTIGGLGTFKDRLQPMEDAAKRLKRKYPELGDVIVKKTGMTEFRLKHIKKTITMYS